MADWVYAPTVLIFGDTEEGRAIAAASATDIGGRIAVSLPLDQALARIDSQISVNLVIVDVTRDHGQLLDQLFRRVEEGAASCNFSSVVVIAPNLVDIATARISHEAVDLLVGRDRELLRVALTQGVKRTPTQLREPPENGEATRLHYLAEAMEQHGRALHAALDSESGAPSRTVPSEALGAVVADFEPIDAAAIRSIIRARRLRAHFFGSGLFADPAWDILLDLIAARLEGRSVAVSSLCIAAAVPATTALRWIKQLTEAGFLRRVADPVDGRRIFIELTDGAARTMMTYFASVSRLGGV